MNRVFRIVWNSSRQLWTVASELASHAGASTSTVSNQSSGRTPGLPSRNGRLAPRLQQVALALAFAGFAGSAAADCTQVGSVFTCSPGTPQSIVIGTGLGSPDGATVTVQPNAILSTGGLPAISMGNNATILIQGGATVQNNVPNGLNGYYGTGANTIEFMSGNRLTIEQGARLLSNGTAFDAEAINPIGTGNVIVNNGEVRSQAGGSAIWLETYSGPNTVINGPTGIIEYQAGTGSIIHMWGTASLNFTNQGQVIGSMVFADGDDTLNIYTGSSITGNIDGRGGNNVLTLNGTGTDTFATPFSNFQTLVKNDSGTWTLGNPLPGSGITSTRVAGGTLILGADASSYTGSMTVDPAGTLQSSAQFAPAAITDNGLVRFAQPTNASYGGLLSGTGGIEKTGAGTLTLTRSQAITGTTTVSAGTLKAGAAGIFSTGSAHVVASGATLDTAGFSQTVASLNNSGTVSLRGTAAGSTLTVTGAYVGNNGVLKLGTVLGDSSSASDRLVLSGAGASASGKTTVQITNLGGLGGLTSGNGIEVVSARNGATTTAQTTRDAFTLANGHVDAGAFEYKLYAGDALGSGESWYLRSAISVPSTAASTPASTPASTSSVVSVLGIAATSVDSASSAPVLPAVSVPTYRAEVPLYAALPAQLRQADLDMIGNLHRRVGDEPLAGRQAWARAIYSDLDIRQAGTAAAHSGGHLSGLQAGTDLLAQDGWRAGLYVGSLDGGADVEGNAHGYFARVGNNNLQSRYLGAYATYMDASGFYADAVLQGADHRYTVRPDGNLSISGKGSGMAASVETGKAFGLGGGWSIEPQAQLIHQRTHLDDATISGAVVRQDANGGWIGRLGLRIKGDLPTGIGRFQPYARLNVYRASSGTDMTTFIGPAASTGIASPSGYTAGEMAGGFTLALTPAASVYGEVGQIFHAGGDTRVKSSVTGSVGMRLSW